MNLDEFYDDEASLPADDLVIQFALADFDRLIDRVRAQAGKSTGIPAGTMFYDGLPHAIFSPPPKNQDHLRDCPERRGEHVAAVSAHTCGEGTCDIDPEFTVAVTCPHVRGVEHRVSAATMGELIDRITAFAS